MSTNLKKVSFVDAFSVASRVATGWELSYPNYTVAFTNFQDLGNKAAILQDTYLQSSLQTNKKSENTADLAAITKELRKAVTKLRMLIKVHYADENIEEVFRGYGMETPGEVLVKPKNGEEKPPLPQKNPDGTRAKDTRPRKKAYFKKPTDTDGWIKLSTAIIAKLSENDNPLKTNTFGFDYWTDLRNRFLPIWKDSSSMRMRKSTLSRQSNELKTELLDVLTRLKKQIRLDFEHKGDINKVFREFGLLAELD